MIPRRYIEEWKETAGWVFDAQVEQDLIICRAITAIFSDKLLAAQLAFCGGTALHKLYMGNQARYSEDIDLVQIKAEPIKDTLDRLREVLGFLGVPIVKQKASNNTAVFRFESEIPPVIKLKLKVEVNCREHFTVLGYQQIPFAVHSGWFTGSCLVQTYSLDELLGTKLRALYQRKKGRDLYDIYKAVSSGKTKPLEILKCYRKYMLSSGAKLPSVKVFSKNMAAKLQDKDFLADTVGLLKTTEKYDIQQAFELIKIELIEKL